VSNPNATYKLRVSYPQALGVPLPSKKDNQRDDILETFDQVKINLPLSEAIRQIPSYTKFLKDLCAFKVKFKDYKSKEVLLRKQVSSILKLYTPPKFTILVFIPFHDILVTIKLKRHFGIWVPMLI